MKVFERSGRRKGMSQELALALAQMGCHSLWPEQPQRRWEVRLGADGGNSYVQPGEFKFIWRGSPGGPVAKIPHSQSRGPRFDPWSGN